MVLSSDLKKSVFQSAMMGQLTERVKNCKPINEILLDISEERKIGVKNKEIKKDKTLFPDMPEEVPFDIPDSWRWVTLGSLCKKIGAGSTPQGGKAVYVSSGIKFIREQNVYNDGLKLEDVAYIPEDIHLAMKGSEVHARDILMNITGASIGRTALVNDEFDTANINQHVLIIRLVNLRMREYIHRCLCSPFIFDQMMKNQKGDKPGLSAQRVGAFLIPLPPIEEQHAIVEKLNIVEKAIDEFAEIENTLNQIQEKFPFAMEKSILQYAMQGKLTEQLKNDGNVELLYETIIREKEEKIKLGIITEGKQLPPIEEDEIPFEIPNNWKWVRWGDISENIQYGYNAPALSKGRIKMVRISDIQDNQVLWETVPYCDITEKDIVTYKLANNDILFARTGGTVGKSFLVKEVQEEAVFAGYLIRTQYSERLVPEYLKYFMESQLYWTQLHNGTSATAQPNCNGKTLSKMILPLPPVEEQRRIVEKLNQILPLCDDLKI